MGYKQHKFCNKFQMVSFCSFEKYVPYYMRKGEFILEFDVAVSSLLCSVGGELPFCSPSKVHASVPLWQWKAWVLDDYQSAWHSMSVPLENPPTHSTLFKRACDSRVWAWFLGHWSFFLQKSNCCIYRKHGTLQKESSMFIVWGLAKIEKKSVVPKKYKVLVKEDADTRGFTQNTPDICFGEVSEAI